MVTCREKIMKQKITCLRCTNKYIDSRDYIFCALETNHSFGFLYRKKEGYKKTPKWCPLRKISYNTPKSLHN